jgi:citronellol/citronellal dehydrogenase
MTMSRSAHIAVVTGASRGIGRAIAIRFASEGIKVVCTSRTAEKGGGRYAGSVAETVAQIHALGGEAIGVPADLGSPDFKANELLEFAEHEFGDRVDIVVNNAAAAREFDMTFERMTRALFLDTLAVNVWAGWNLASHALTGMRERGAGWILNISSRGAAPRLGPPYENGPPIFGQCLYASSKAMIDRLTTGAASELWASNVAVNALAPEGGVATENAVTVANVSPEWSEPEETMAEAALVLCTGDPAQLTGNVAYSLSLIVALGRSVHTLDGKELLPGWQPEEIAAEKRLGKPYLVGAGRLASL